MHQFNVRPSSRQSASADADYRNHLQAHLNKNPRQLPRKGYIRALELYGNERNMSMRSPGNWSKLQIWRETNPILYAKHRADAIARGYDPDEGTVVSGVYTSTLAFPGPPTVLEDAAQEEEEDEEPRSLPVSLVGSEQSYRDANQEPDQEREDNRPKKTEIKRTPATAQQSGNPRRTPYIAVTNESRPFCLNDFGGNFMPKVGEEAMNGAGLAGITNICEQMLEVFIASTATPPSGSEKAFLLDRATELVEWMKRTGVVDAQRRYFQSLVDDTPQHRSSNPFLTGSFKAHMRRLDA